MLSVGVPMLSGGDEVGRTPAWQQQRLLSGQRHQLDAVGSCRAPTATSWNSRRRVIRIWKDHPVLRRRKFFQGRRIRGAEVFDITWLDPSGREMTDDDLELARRPLSRRAAERRRHRRSGRAWRTNHRRLAGPAVQRRRDSRFLRPAGRERRKNGGRRSSTPRTPGDRHGDLRRRTAISCSSRSMAVLRLSGRKDRSASHRRLGTDGGLLRT